jgi:hypothetical protein
MEVKEKPKTKLFVDKTINYKMNNEIKYRWIEYLTNNHFNFNTGSLKSLRSVSPIGTLCELFVKESGGKNKWQQLQIKENVTMLSIFGESFVIPKEIQLWAELDSFYVYTNVYQMITKTDSKGEKYVKKIFLTLDDLYEEGFSKEALIEIIDKSYN